MKQKRKGIPYRELLGFALCLALSFLVWLLFSPIV